MGSLFRGARYSASLARRACQRAWPGNPGILSATNGKSSPSTRRLPLIHFAARGASNALALTSRERQLVTAPNHVPQTSANRKTPSLKFSLSGAPKFVDFILPQRVMQTTRRGELLALYKTLISAGAFPPIDSWADLYHFMIRRGSSNETINDARKLWREYTKSQIAVSPANNRRAKP